MKLFAAPILMFMLSAGCHSKTDPQASTSFEDSEFLVKDVGAMAGVFYDTLDCEDCSGTATSLYLKPDSTFVMEKRHTDKKTVYQTGRWVMNDSLLQLSAVDTVFYLGIVNFAQLTMRTPAIRRPDGSPGKTNLRRNNSPFKPLQPIPVSGMFSAVEDTFRLYICSMQHEYPASLAPSALLTKVKYRQNAKPGEPLFATLTGHFELRPSLTDTTTKDFFVIEKLVSFDKQRTCPTSDSAIAASATR